MDLLKNVNGKMLRCGYTTGSCATAATKAAMSMLLTGKRISSVVIHTPVGFDVTTEVLDISMDREKVRCAVRKDPGDDPDVTRDMLVYSEVSLCDSGVHISGGEGIGRVTRPGLDQPVGEYAINSVPRRMIAEAIKEVSAMYGYSGGADIEISIPGGEAVARRTFNPRMGIEGGLSILGTSGIVEPMSCKALTETTNVLIKQCRARGNTRILLTPGNYGYEFAENDLGLDMSYNVNCSNFIGGALDRCAELGFTRILLVGHIGKLVKLGIGATNTHSSEGDGRLDCLIRCALEAGAPLQALQELDRCVTTDAGLDVLRRYEACRRTMDVLGKKIGDTLERRVPADIETGFVCFTRAEGHRGVLCRSENAFSIIPARR